MTDVVESVRSKATEGEEDISAVGLMEAAGLTPDDWQRELLAGDWQRAILNVCRQGGKSTCTAALALETALSRPDALVLILAPARRQSKELLLKVRQMYRDAGPETRIEKWSELRLRLENGSRIIALPGREATVRGYTADLIIADEASRVPDELYSACRPMLAVSGGRLVALSTPAGQRGWFYEAWTDPQQAWGAAVKVTGHDCPRLSESFLETERREMGGWQFQSEYMCEFTDTEDQLFATEHIESSLTTEVGALFDRDEDTGEYLSDTEPLFSDTQGDE